MRAVFIAVFLSCGLLWQAAAANPLVQATLAQPEVRVSQVQLDGAALEAVYAPRQYEPIWLLKGNINPAAQPVYDALANSGRHGLSPADYNITEINALLKSTTPAELLAFDLLLTDGFLRYVADLRVGRVTPRRLKGEMFQVPPTVDPVAVLNGALAAPDFAGFIKNLSPPSPVYAGLVQVLAQLRAAQVNGEWPQLSDGPRLEPKASSPRINEVRRRLAASGDLGPAAPEGVRYDEPLVAAVKAFQTRAGLKADGRIGVKTRDVLNVSLQQRISQTLANMERLRWQAPLEMGRAVVVNIPAFELTAFENGQPALHMDTITGRPERKTPIFSDNIRYLEFNPVWHLPPTIVREDVLPHLREDPSYALEHKNVRIYKNGVEVDPYSVDWANVGVHEYRMRAAPGPRNPLGTVKFMFPNRFDVYLHDTSEREKFAEDIRALSSGCVRVADPAALTNWLLGDKPGWSDEKRLKILESARQTQVQLAAPVPVHLIYVTVWLGADDKPVFRTDIYGHDAVLAAALAQAEAKPRRLIASAMHAAASQPAPNPAVDPNVPVEKAAP